MNAYVAGDCTGTPVETNPWWWNIDVRMWRDTLAYPNYTNAPFWDVHITSYLFDANWFSSPTAGGSGGLCHPSSVSATGAAGGSVGSDHTTYFGYFVRDDHGEIIGCAVARRSTGWNYTWTTFNATVSS
jgi:hypothetical protein